MLNDIYNPSNVVIDVRSPSEYERGHIPHAISIALFSDDERAAVGTAYVQEGHDRAVEIGLEYVLPKMSSLISSADSLRGAAISGSVILYCWRGGMRSAAFAWLLRKEGIEATVIPRGYKAYRQKVITDIGQHGNFIVLSGKTGIGKTRLLEELRLRGCAVINLEEIARHRGSAFGSIGMPLQPTSEHAMNIVHSELMRFTSKQTIIIEDESQSIGTVSLDVGLMERIRTSPRILLDVPVNVRLQNLCMEYGTADPIHLEEGFKKIHRKLGGARLAVALSELHKGNFHDAARVALDYYDATYDYTLRKYASTIVSRISSGEGKINELADRVMNLINTKHLHGL
ncbi:MAG: tRNA 2-selenouridine(34) synthase MnmH [Ignavibacteria bacterium]|nr:tRNA 2-selenouridine(34) synthase MnmH [Ignavibacteria bacterium]